MARWDRSGRARGSRNSRIHQRNVWAVGVGVTKSSTELDSAFRRTIIRGGGPLRQNNWDIMVTGTISITLPKTQFLPAKPPHTYLGVAYAMLPGVRVLATSTPLPALPLALISAHVLECILKGYLSRSGDDSQLRRLSDRRHNLNKLWSLARGEGLNIPSEPPQWVDCLSHLHDAPYYLRYSTGVHAISTPAPEPMCIELSALIERVRSQLQ
jgi:hypothetical protein